MKLHSCLAPETENNGFTLEMTRLRLSLQSLIMGYDKIADSCLEVFLHSVQILSGRLLTHDLS